MTVATDIANATASHTNTDVSSGTDACLLANGFTTVEIDQIKHLYDEVLDVGDIADLEAEAQIYLDKIDEATHNLGSANDINQTKEVGGGSNYDPQDVTYPRTSPEPEVLISSVAPMPKFPDASYSPSEDYPNSYAKIDKALNWYKVNKEQSTIEFVHSSGTSMKVNKAGDVSLNIVGDFKVTVGGNHNTNIYGSEDRGVLGQSFLSVTKGIVIESGGNWTLTGLKDVAILSAAKLSAIGSSSITSFCNWCVPGCCK